MFGRRLNSNQARIYILGFSANRVLLVDRLAAGGQPVDSRFSRLVDFR